jgi:CheY-like chemotaxis protein
MARILVIDDDDAVRTMVVTALERAGHIVSEASTGLEGTRRFHREPADLVITDMVMPDQDGIETVMALRREYAGLPIIAISGLARDSALYLEIAAKLGACRTLQKPFRLEALLQTTKEVLDEQNNPPPSPEAG